MCAAGLACGPPPVGLDPRGAPKARYGLRKRTATGALGGSDSPRESQPPRENPPRCQHKTSPPGGSSPGEWEPPSEGRLGPQCGCNGKNKEEQERARRMSPERLIPEAVESGVQRAGHSAGGAGEPCEPVEEARGKGHLPRLEDPEEGQAPEQHSRGRGPETPRPHCKGTPHRAPHNPDPPAEPDGTVGNMGGPCPGSIRYSGPNCSRNSRLNARNV